MVKNKQSSLIVYNKILNIDFRNFSIRGISQNRITIEAGYNDKQGRREPNVGPGPAQI